MLMTQAVATEPQRQPLEMNVWVRRPEGNLERPRMKAESDYRASCSRKGGRPESSGRSASPQRRHGEV